MKKKFIRFYNQIYFWLTVSRSLSCKHCCVNCVYYDSCFEEFTDIEKAITPQTYFD